MAPKYKNDLDKCFSLLKFKHNWKAACEDDATFAEVVSDIASQLTTDSKFSAELTTVSSSGDQESVAKSIETFLSEYGCPCSSLIGPSNERFATTASRMSLLRYLCTELMAKHRLNQRSQSTLSHPSHVSSQASSDVSMELSAHLHSACTALGLPMPAAGFNPVTTIGDITKAASDALKRCPPSYFGQPMIPLKGLSDRQWSQVARIAALLQQEYAARQAMLLKRLDVTIQSFKWSEKAKSQLEAITAVYHPIRSAMAKSRFPGIPELLAVRDNMILRIEKTSGSRARLYTSCPLNKILIGQVPDRGGRAWELEPPPPEMPSFKQRQPDRGRGAGIPGGRPDSGRGARGGRGSFNDRGAPRVGYSASQQHQQQQVFRPCAPSAQLGGVDYVVTPAAYAALNQQMSGLAFEPGFGAAPPHVYQYQVTGDGNYRPSGAPYRGRGSRGGRGRPY